MYRCNRWLWKETNVFDAKKSCPVFSVIRHSQLPMNRIDIENVGLFPDQ